MAEMFDVHGNVFDAILSALRRATREERSMTLFTPIEADGYMEWFMVGATSKTEGMVEAGAVPCWSFQAHTKPQPEERERCWADLEAEAAVKVSAFELETPPEVDRAP